MKTINTNLMKKRIIIIAEAGINHNGNINKAKKLIDAASNAGADVVKFQSYKTESLIQKNIDKKINKLKDYDSEAMFNLLKKYELDFYDFLELKKYSKRKKIILHQHLLI